MTEIRYRKTGSIILVVILIIAGIILGYYMGTGEPDIIALDPDGTEIAVSVKLYSYARPRHSLDKEEFNPELNYRDQNEAEAWIWYTNLEWGGTGGKTYFEEIPEALDRVVLHKKKGLVE